MAVPHRPAPRRRDAEWLQDVARRVNDDPEMAIIGGQFDATISFTFGSDKHDLVLRAGKVADMRHGKKLDWRSDFGFRAPDAVWDRFFQSPPPPLYNSVFAMIMRVPDFQVEGDTLVLAQNARAFTRLMNLMQEMGAAS
jgi:hypothetical protein